MLINYLILIFLLVLIVAKCNVNVTAEVNFDEYIGVLIVAKCNVN